MGGRTTAHFIPESLQCNPAFASKRSHRVSQCGLRLRSINTTASGQVIHRHRRTCDTVARPWIGDPARFPTRTGIGAATSEALEQVKGGPHRFRDHGPAWLRLDALSPRSTRMPVERSPRYEGTLGKTFRIDRSST